MPPSPWDNQDMLARGDRVPHFEVRTLDGARLRYSDVWQRRNLVLIVLAEPDLPAARQYAADVAGRLEGFENTIYALTDERLPALQGTNVLVADRWGEIYFAAEAAGVAALPTPDDLADWLLHVGHECPECQGEAR